MNLPEKIVLYGVGLMNGSLGLALKARGYKGKIVGLGRRAETLQNAYDLGIVDEWRLNPAEGLRGAPLVVIGTPVDSVAATVGKLTEHADPQTLFTDVGSVKAEVVRECARFAPTTPFVGAHPLVGSEQTGAKAARANLFEKATCILTPTRTSSSSDVALVRRLWEFVGARVVELAPEVHDALLATSSHLPHVVACALVRVVAETIAEGHSALEFTAGGFRDTTRIAAASAEMWIPILRTNREEILVALRRLCRELETVADAIEKDHVEVLQEWWHRAAEIRRALTGKLSP